MRASQLQIANRKSQIKRGFSFPEILFAVAVLGIGFIMVAAIFPVAIMQTQATMEETVGTAVTRNGISYVRGSPLVTTTSLAYTPSAMPPSVAVPPNPPPPAHPGAFYSFRDPRIDNTVPPNNAVPPNPAKADPTALWNSVKQNLIVPDDPRFAYIPVYCRDPGSNFAKVIVIGVRIRNRDAFKASVPTGSTDIPDIERRAANICAELEPRPVKVTLIDGAATNTADRIVIEAIDFGPQDLQDLSSGSDAVQAAAPGAYVIISEDTIPDAAATPYKNEHGRLNGRVYRLGPETNTPAPPANARQFELAPGDDMPSSAGPDNTVGTPDDVTEDMANTLAFIVGRGYAGTTGAEHSGPSMAVQHYENVIPLP